MQSKECGPVAGVSAEDAHRYNVFHLAAMVGVVEWRNGSSLAFPPSEVGALDGSAVTPACIGLLGMAGALPYHYSEAIARDGTAAARDFMDLLSAPATGYFCDAWREGRPEFTPLPVLPPHRGALRARALSEQLAQALGVPLRIEQFAGRWDSLPPSQQSALGSGNACCGAGALLGQRLWRPDSAVIIHIGALASRTAQDFLPGARGALALAELWRSAAGSGNLLAEARIHLLAGACSGATLGKGVRLGHDALLTMAVAGERDDLRYRLC